MGHTELKQKINGKKKMVVERERGNEHRHGNVYDTTIRQLILSPFLCVCLLYIRIAEIYLFFFFFFFFAYLEARQFVIEIGFCFCFKETTEQKNKKVPLKG